MEIFKVNLLMFLQKIFQNVSGGWWVKKFILLQ